MKFYEYSDKRSAKSFITIEQTPETVQYIESNAARMGVSVQNVVDAMITAQYNSIKSGARTEKAPMDKTTYELRKQLKLAQYRPADEVIEWRGYRFYAGAAAEALKHLNGQFSKPSKKQLLLFEAEIAAAPAPVQDQQQPEPAAAPVEDIEAAVVAHFEDLAANAPADDPAADILRASIETGKVIICSVPKAEPTTPASEKTETEPAPVKKQKEFAEYHGAVVEVLEYRENDVLIKIKGGTMTTAEYGQLLPTKAKKCTLPECFKVGGFLSLNGSTVRIEYIGTTRVEVFYIEEEEWQKGCTAWLLSEYDSEAPDPDAIGEIVTIPTEQKTAPTDAEVMETAARIRANYEAMQADIEAEREQAAAAFAEAITAYCEELEQPEPLAWEPETIIIPFEPRPAAEVEQPRRRHRLNLRPRLSRWLHPARWVAVTFVVCLLSGLLLGMNTSTAAADDIAAAYDLAPVTVNAEALDTFIEDKAPRLIEYKAPCLIEDKAPAPSPVKKLAAPSTVKNVADAAECSSQKTDTADTPAGEKTASPMNTASDPHGLTICEGTPWAYTMMNWA